LHQVRRSNPVSRALRRTLLCCLYVAGLLVSGMVSAQSEPVPDTAGAANRSEREPQSEARAAAGSRPKTGLRGDRWQRRVVAGESVSILIGNVFIDRDSLTARCDSAHHYPDRQVYKLFGNVEIRQLDQAVVYCERADFRQQGQAADFHGDTRVVEGAVIGTGQRGESRNNGRLLRLIGGALLVTPEYSVWADTLLRDRESGNGEAFGNVKIIDPQARTLITGQHAEFSGDGNLAVVDRDPVLTSRDGEGESIKSTSRIMTFFRDEERVVMTDSVRIAQGRTEARADTAVVYGKRRMILAGAPFVRFDTRSNMTGREIEFRYLRGQLDRIVLRGAARTEDSSPDSLAALYPGLPALDILEGDTLTIELVDQEIERSVVIGNAHSIYTPTDLDDEIATNDVVGDTIIIHFRNEEVYEVDVYGNMSGQYRFARLDQLNSASDTLSNATAAVDTLPTAAAVDSSLAIADVDTSSAYAAVDTTRAVNAGAAPRASAGDFTAGAETVDYSGGSVIFQLTDREIEITHDAKLVYGTLNLEAQKVIFDTVERELYADGDPLLVDTERIAGQQMGYNFGARTGAVRHGVTTFDNNYYVGDQISRFDDGSLKILSGKMTSCEMAEPHYHFWSDKMKMKLKDKVVAKPVVLKVGRVPIFALPFFFKSLKSGRRSGIIFPTFDFGWNSRDGRFIRNLGYFWATNDYTDFRFETDYTERRELTMLIANQYIKRYTFTGNLQYSHQWRLAENAGSRQWQFRWNHNQDHLFDDYNFRADVQMASETLSSNDLSRNTSRDVISGQLRSNVHVSRNFSFMSSSLAMTRDERVNARDDDPANDKQIYNQTLPSLSLGLRQWQLLPSLRTGQKGSFIGDLLRATYFKQSYSGRATRSQHEVTTRTSESANGSWSLDMRPPRVGIFNVSTGVSASQAWQRSTTEGLSYVEPVDPDTVGTFADYFARLEETTSTLSLNTNANTTLYGIFPVRIGRLQALRHKLQMRAGYSLFPSLGEKQPRRESYTLSVNNSFDVKYLGRDGADSTFTEKKLTSLIDWSLGTSYNPARDRDSRWADISSGLTIKPGSNRNLALKVSNTIDPYRRSLLSTRFNYSLNLRGRIDTGHQPVDIQEQRNETIDRLGFDPAAADTTGRASMYDDDYGDGFDDDFEDDFDDRDRDRGGGFYDGGFAGLEDPLSNQDGQDTTEGGRFIPWNCGGSISYNRGTSGDTTVRANMSLSMVLTRNWDFSYQSSFDLGEGRITNQRWSLNRNLHCWRIEFTRIINSLNSEYAFRLYLLSMPEVKVPLGNDDLLGSVQGLGGGFMP